MLAWRTIPITAWLLVAGCRIVRCRCRRHLRQYHHPRRQLVLYRPSDRRRGQRRRQRTIRLAPAGRPDAAGLCGTADLQAWLYANDGPGGQPGPPRSAKCDSQQRAADRRERPDRLPRSPCRSPTPSPGPCRSPTRPPSPSDCPISIPPPSAAARITPGSADRVHGPGCPVRLPAI